MEKTNLIINSTVDIGDNIEIETNGKGRKFVSRFIEAGVAHYEQFGDVLITKETLDKFIQSMVGCPVIIKHKDITDENADKERVGVVSRVWFNEQDGWYYCEGIIWDKQAIDLVKNQGWNVSCTYDFESDKQPKTHNGKKVDMEFIDGDFLHLALVPNPRYERANIVINSKADIVENEDKWITIKPNGEDGKGRHLLLKDGESPKEAIERTYGKEDKKESAIEKRHKFQEVKKNRNEVYKEFEKGNGSLEDIEKADKEYEKAYKEFYGGSDTAQKDNKKDKFRYEGKTKIKQITKKDEDRHQKVRDLEEKAYKEFKTLHDNYIQGNVKTSDFGKATEQFNKKYKEEFDKLESDRFVSFEDLAKREHSSQSKKEDKKEDKTEESYKLKEGTKVTQKRFDDLFDNGSYLENHQFRKTIVLDNRHQVSYDKKRGLITFYEQGDLHDSKNYDAPKGTVGMIEKFRTNDYNKLVDYLFDINEEWRLNRNKAENALISGLETILDEHQPEKTDLPILNGLRDIFEK